jgi:hypothetical protein
VTDEPGTGARLVGSRRILFIELPPRWIVRDVFTDASKILIAPDDAIIEAALPDGPRKQRAARV